MRPNIGWSPRRTRCPSSAARARSAQIPALRDGGFHLADSTAICHYLERRFPEPPLFPAEPSDYGRMVWLDQFAGGALGAAECIVVTNRVLSGLRGQAPDRGAVAAAVERDLPRLCDYLEGAIAGPFLIGDRLSLADIAVACPFVSLRIAGRSPDVPRWPRLTTYLAGILARPAFAALPDWAGA